MHPILPGPDRRVFRVLNGILVLGLGLAGYQAFQSGFARSFVVALVWVGILGLFIYFAYFSASEHPSPLRRMLEVAGRIVAAMLAGGLILYIAYSLFGSS